jgi:diadenosine tetraphosphatase ApaH/serine/threonine PP2A family protein phosphatase
MKLALISDIHANLEAFEAVLADIARQEITEIYCLGDIVGFGPDPARCIDLAMKLTCCILGNHDLAALDATDGTGAAIDGGTQQLLDQQARNVPGQARRRDFLASLPLKRREQGRLFVHGSPRNPVHECIFPEDIYNERKLSQVFSLVDRHCFHGHTHIPGILTESRVFLSPEEIGYEYRLTDERALINIGSVGQPRDGDVRACYVVLDDDLVLFRRVDYPFEETIRKIKGPPK